jgi:MYXO-CTERM domain-containing protein
MSVLADYLRRRREDGETATAGPTERVTAKRVGLAVAVAVLGAAVVRRLRRRRPNRRRRSDD